MIITSTVHALASESWQNQPDKPIEKSSSVARIIFKKRTVESLPIDKRKLNGYARRRERTPSVERRPEQHTVESAESDQQQAT